MFHRLHILDSIDKNKLKNLFNKCQENGGIMWHDVVSFDNKFLEKHGIYDSKNKLLDNRKLKEVIRSSANETLKKEKLGESAIWCADIHYNTDNIHVHVSTVELNSSKERGKRKPNSILAMKSKVVNGIINNNEQYKKINDIIRKDIIENKKKVKYLDNIKLKKLFIEIHSKLPEDRKQWNYNYNTLNHVRPLIDKMTDIYIEKYHKDDFFKLKEELKKQEINLKEAYGEGKNNSYKKYYDTKIKDLKTRMGSTILKEIKEYDYSLNGRRYKNNLSKSDRKILIKNSIVAVSLKKIEKLIENNYQHYKNQKEYEKLQNEIERNE
ncbi:MobP2 family relaxase [Clostridium estertheticum]|uniref:MobP2 family relaxase n=1 Tax=Clostridium estertheticum TaxID=238834 RepID=UPI001C7D482F|nr:MobP2 family relaxase [Clostridium estertheticum]MBX4265656.1 relaxase MobL [Clostridium estertheticum]WLC91003.1 relaxase MobL [Clostridium estertheticum]